MICTCPDWAPNTRQINEVLALHQFRIGKQMDFKKFKFCPYCARELTEDDGMISRPAVSAQEGQAK